MAVGFLLDAEGARSLFWAYLPFLVATAVVTATIPRRRGATRSVSLLRGAGEFLSTKGVALFLVGFTVVWASLAAVTAFYSIQVVALGGSPGLVGIAWAVGAAIEVPYMYAFPRVAGWFGTERLVVIGSLAFALRGLLAALAVDPVALVLIAPLEGLGFASVFVGGVTVLAAHAPTGLQGTAQGVFAACAGLATIIGSFGGGAIAGALVDPGAVPRRRGRQPGRHRDRGDRAPRSRHRPDPPPTRKSRGLNAGAGRAARRIRSAARRHGQSSRASSATSRTRSMNRYSQSRALISAILPASAGWVLTSRSCSSEATW